MMPLFYNIGEPRGHYALDEISWSQKEHDFTLSEVPKAVKFREAESKMVAWGRRKQELLFNRYKVSSYARVICRNLLYDIM